MRHRILGVFFALLACGSPRVEATSAASKPTAVQVPPDLRVAVERAQHVGRMLMLLDAAAAVATPAAVESGARTDVLGYLALPRTDGYQVSYFVSADPPLVGYRVNIVGNEKPEGKKLVPPEAATAIEARLFRARQSAVAAVNDSTQRRETVVLPGGTANETGVLVYLLASPSHDDAIALGKHYRVRTSDDGASVLAVEALSKDAIELAPPARKGDSLVVRDAVNDHPTEVHVFTSLSHEVSIQLVTSRGTWTIDGSKITLSK